MKGEETRGRERRGNQGKGGRVAERCREVTLKVLP